MSKVLSMFMKEQNQNGRRYTLAPLWSVTTISGQIFMVDTREAFLQVRITMVWKGKY